MSDTQQRRIEEAQHEMDASANEMERRSEQLGDEIKSTKETFEQTKRSETVPTAAGDWEDSEPDDSTGEDPSGFDDPESVDLDDEDLEDDDGVADEDA